MSIDITQEINVHDDLILDPQATDTLFLEARTANSWADGDISEQTLQTIYALTRMAPTAMNIQPLRISWIRSPEARARLVAHMSEGNKAKTLTAPMVAVLSYDTDWHELMPTTAPHAAGMIPTFAANDSLRQGMAANNAHIQAGFFIMAARAAGLAAGPMGGFDASGIDAEFNSGTQRKAFLVVNLGRPNGIVDRDRLHRLEFDAATQTL